MLKKRIYLLIFPLVINLEEKQQTTLTEWYSAQENTFKPESQRQRTVPNVTDEYDLLDDGGDAVFSQLVRPHWFHTSIFSENCVVQRASYEIIIFYCITKVNSLSLS